MDAVKFIVCVQGPDELAQIFVGFSKIHRGFVMLFHRLSQDRRRNLNSKRVTISDQQRIRDLWPLKFSTRSATKKKNLFRLRKDRCACMCAASLSTTRR